MLAQVQAGLAARAGSRGEHSRGPRTRAPPASATLDPVPDPFIAAAGPAPARGTEGRWRQVALLSASSALGDSRPRRHRPGGRAAGARPPGRRRRGPQRADADDPWARWWGVLAAGQAAGRQRPARRARPPPARRRPRARTRARWRGGWRTSTPSSPRSGATPTPAPASPARATAPGRERRMLLAGRSSAAFLVEPGWEALRLVRLAPSEGPALGNRAHTTLLEVIAAVRRGEAGPGWDVPGDEAADLDPEAMLGALREDPAARDRRLVRLAQEVAEERERLMEERAALAEERASLAAERSRRRRVARSRRPPPPRRRERAAAAQRRRGRRAPGPGRRRRAGRGGARLPRPGHRAATPTASPGCTRPSAARRRGSPWRSTRRATCCWAASRAAGLSAPAGSAGRATRAPARDALRGAAHGRGRRSRACRAAAWARSAAASGPPTTTAAAGRPSTRGRPGRAAAERAVAGTHPGRGRRRRAPSATAR